MNEILCGIKLSKYRTGQVCERKTKIQGVVLLPAGKGSHIELGIALGNGKTIYLYSPNQDIDNIQTTSTFYHLPEVLKCIGSLDELVEMIETKSKILLI